MYQLIKILMAITVLLSFATCNAQIKNATSESVKIFGNCEMCETTIEKAGNKKKIAKVDWNKDTKMAVITYDSTQTNKNEILKRIALSGYDNEQFLAPNDVYANLPKCCQYERKAQTLAKVDLPEIGMKEETPKIEEKGDYSTHNHSVTIESKQELHQLNATFDYYFAVIDALVETDGNTASTKAKELLTAINAVKMNELTADEHTVWMNVMEDLAFDAEHIADTKDVSHQRDHFITLSKNIYALMKVSKQESTTYYQFCPMANEGKGANWLSKENEVKNPYYGSKMINCGKVVETIK